MTHAQSAVILAALTITAVIIGLFFGSILSRRRAHHLKSALEDTNTQNELLKYEVDSALGEVQQYLTTTVEGIGQLRAAVSEIPTSADRPNQSGDWASLDQIRDDWNAIRDDLERRAADPKIHGRTRSKYGRVDRRSYPTLIDMMNANGNLQHEVADFRAAHSIWSQHKRGHQPPDQAPAIQMNMLRQRLVRG